MIEGAWEGVGLDTNFFVTWNAPHAGARGDVSGSEEEIQRRF
ncbi:MAG: hypothetical protein ACLSCV_04260 [Acutalibacteraceae bacterium]